MFSSLYSFFVSWDNYGEPVMLNYKGETKYKTLPGAMISILGRMFILGYMYFKINALLTN
jgi:hypothetical protein